MNHAENDTTIIDTQLTSQMREMYKSSNSGLKQHISHMHQLSLASSCQIKTALESLDLKDLNTTAKTGKVYYR